MISVLTISSNIKYSFAKDFIIESILNFYEEIDLHSQLTSRTKDKYHIGEYGEMGLVNYFNNGIVRGDKEHRFLMMNEFELEKDDKNAGRFDLVVEDYLLHRHYYIEAKKVNSKEDAPLRNDWKMKESKKYYKIVQEQAKGYLEADFNNYDYFDSDYISDYEFFTVALIFDFVKFSDPHNMDALKEWKNYELNLDNEFYGFKTFEHKKELIGIACYGTVELAKEEP